jgi:hypothetical protein
MRVIDAMLKFLVYGFVIGVLIGLLAWLGGAR